MTALTVVTLACLCLFITICVDELRRGWWSK